MIVLHFWANTLVIWPGQVLGVGMIASMIWLFWKAQTSKSNPIDFSTMFMWPGSQQTSLILFLAFVAGMAGIWIIVDREFRGVLTTEMFGLWLATMIFGKGATEAINAWRDRGPPPPAPAAAPNQIIGTAAQVNAAPATTAQPIATPPPLPAKSKRRRKRG